jgi:biotin carboxyl carrier protein
MDQKKLFRKAALDRLSSPEQLHTLMRVTNAKGWLALVGCALVIVTAAVWGMLGRVQTKVAANGILLGGAGFAEVASHGDGELSSIEVKVGDVIKRGHVVAKVSQPALEQQIANRKRRLEGPGAEGDAAAPDVADRARRDRLREEIDHLQKQLVENAEIESLVAGQVVEVRASIGDRVTAGAPVITVELASAKLELEALIYFSAHVGKSLKPGMTIEIVPSVVRKERHGVLLGRVRAVETYPATRAGMMGALRNEQLVESFVQSAGGAPIAVRAELLTDASTPSGYRWSSGAGPAVTLTSGTQCTGAAITRTHRPIALVFPALDYGE